MVIDVIFTASLPIFFDDPSVHEGRGDLCMHDKVERSRLYCTKYSGYRFGTPPRPHLSRGFLQGHYPQSAII